MFYFPLSSEAKPYETLRWPKCDYKEKRLPARVFIRNKFNIEQSVMIANKTNYRTYLKTGVLVGETLASGYSGFILNKHFKIIGMVFPNCLIEIIKDNS